MLSGVRVVLGVCGSIAAVRTVELAHELRRQGADVTAVMSSSATDIIHSNALAFATDREVVTDLTGAIEHVALCGTDGWGDVFVVAPATANTIGKIAGTIDDTPVTTCATTAIGAGMPIVIAPAMHEPMYDHPGIDAAIDQLRDWEIDFVDPRIEEGKAKIAAHDDIVTAVARATSSEPLAGTTVVVTSGPTTEAIDPVRILTNRSSGRMGRAIARACYVLGADVELIHDGPAVPYASVTDVTTAAEMRAAAIERAPEADALISAAAIGDFDIESSPTKLDSGRSHTVTLEPTPKVIDAVREVAPSLRIVVFKAGTGRDQDLETAAADLQERVDAVFVVANEVSVMGSATTAVTIVDGDDLIALDGTKADVAMRIVERLASHLGTK